MGKIISYTVYFLIAVALYVLIRAAYSGSITSETTIGDAATEVKEGSIDTLKEIKDSIAETIATE